MTSDGIEFSISVFFLLFFLCTVDLPHGSDNRVSMQL